MLDVDTARVFTIDDPFVTLSVPFRFRSVPFPFHLCSQGLGPWEHEWSENGTTKHPNGSKMDPKWNPNGSTMEPKWIQNGTKMDPKWSRMDLKWNTQMDEWPKMEQQNGTPKWNTRMEHPNGTPKWIQNCRMAQNGTTKHPAGSKMADMKLKWNRNGKMNTNRTTIEQENENITPFFLELEAPITYLLTSRRSGW
jgi:hypothetical protein